MSYQKSADSGVSRLVTQQGLMESTTQYFLNLAQKGKVQAEYIWIGGSGEDLRSKTKTLTKEVRSLKDLPDWNYDGSSTDQATGNDSEVWLIPVKYVPDPFRPGPNVLVLCETLAASNMKPLETNKRAAARAVFENPIVEAEKTWYGIEQEYTLFESDGVTPLGWPKDGYPGPQGPYYCSVGARRAVGRQIVESHYRACLYAGLDISGINAEVMCGQWEYQVGPCVGIDSPDQVWLSRYILERVAEKFGVVVSFSAKPIKGDWNGAGAHTNFSTKSMRTPDPTHVPKTGNSDEKLDRIVIEEKSSSSSSKKGGYGGSGSVRTSGRSGKKGRDQASSNADQGLKLIGYKAVVAGIEKLGARHAFHMEAYGKGNQDRLLGTHETARFDQFSYGVANRGCSVRIPRMTEKEGYGYLEDRRPAANCDPYSVTSLIADTILLQ